MVNRSIGRYGKRQYKQAWDFIRVGSYGGVSTVDVIFSQGMLNKYRAIRVLLTDLKPDVDAYSDLYLRLSTDFGSTFSSGASDYQFGMQFMATSTVAAPNGGGDNSGDIIYAGFFYIDLKSSIEYTFFTPGVSAHNPISIKGSTLNWTYKASGQFVASNVVTAARFYSPTASLFSGVYILTGKL